ncbi:protein kinase family protein [Bradyrhizobium sp. YR681]|uniref:serine/threonine protein kinase n=1 Tax=Bradyrhizobium sp. YR681 TaxID=1144344 RepID=UPI00026F6372|nr:protein kinase [Bradyrhizobium sp. YR681]EJN07135.1 protein kinase family protein [Bradyrhizobium sp. YR681]
MDSAKAKEWEDRFRGKTIESWTIESLIDHGKSAAVFRATGKDGLVALKIFDDEIIQRYGDETQLGRIKRELTLLGKKHPNMVRLLGGGVDKESENHFIVMEFLDGPSLSKCLARVPEANIPSLIEQLVSACEFLESLNLAHRDIKPANIVLLENLSRLVLLDFGVLKPIGEAGVTDVDGQRLFVGTLQYSSPEFLLRDEANDADGWRALAIYQVGAVLHDLIMRRPIFEEFVNPYAALVNAVQHELPNVASETAPSYLVDACRMSLVKDPAKRLDLVKWDSFRPPQAMPAAEEARRRVGQRILLATAETAVPVQDTAAASELLDTVIDGLKIEVRRIRQANASLIPPVEVTRLGRNSPMLSIRLKPSESLQLTKELQLKIAVDVIDVDAQAIAVMITASASSSGTFIDPDNLVEVFKGPYSSNTIGDRIGAALFLCLDQVQQGVEGPLHLEGLGGV